MIKNLKEVIKLLRSLQKHKVLYIIHGGIAAVLHGVIHDTEDIDIFYQNSDENLFALVNFLNAHAHQYDKPTLKDLQCKSFHYLMIDNIKLCITESISWRPQVAHLNYDNLIKRAVYKKYFGWIVCIEDLISLRQARGSDKDLMVIEQLKIIGVK